MAASEGHEPPPLAPTSFILSEDSRIVEEYTVNNVQAGDTIALGVVLPQSAAATAGPAVGAMLDLKRNPDRWSIAWYGALEAAPPGEVPAKVEERPSLLLADDPTALHKRIANPTAVFATSSAAAQLLLTSLANAGGSRHLLVIEELGEQDSGQSRLWDSLAIQAKTSSISMHAIAVAANSAGHSADFCDRTGGLYLRARYSEELTECCSKLYLALLNRYELSYQSEAAGAKAIKLQIHSELGCGESLFALNG